MLVAISHYKANVDSFHVVVLSSDMGWCTFNFCYQQARVLRLLDLVKWQVSQNQRITSSVQTGVGSCIFKGGRLTCRTLLRRLKLLMLVRWQLKKAEPWLWRQQKRQIACVVNACFCQQERTFRGKKTAKQLALDQIFKNINSLSFYKIIPSILDTFPQRSPFGPPGLLQQTWGDVVRQAKRKLCDIHIWHQIRHSFMGLASVWSVKLWLYMHFRKHFLVPRSHLWSVVVSRTSMLFWLFSRNVTSWYTRGPHLQCGYTWVCHHRLGVGLQIICSHWASQVALVVKNLAANAGDVNNAVSSLGWEDPLEEGMTTLRYSCLENPMDRGAWQFIGSQRVGHNWSDLARTHAICSY